MHLPRKKGSLDNENQGFKYYKQKLKKKDRKSIKISRTNLTLNKKIVIEMPKNAETLGSLVCIYSKTIENSNQIQN
jgi:hypothetical protein